MTIQKTKEWFEAAVPVPTEASFNVQLGCHLEEVVEMLGNMRGLSTDAEYAIASAEAALSRLADGMKRGEFSAYIVCRAEHLDALADQIVTAVGCAHMLGMDIVGALDEVNRSNFSKFEDGKPVFDENGKIKKGRDYKAPELAGFAGDLESAPMPEGDGAVYLNYSCNSCGVAPGDRHKDDCQFYDQDGSAVIRNNQDEA